MLLTRTRALATVAIFTLSACSFGPVGYARAQSDPFVSPEASATAFDPNGGDGLSNRTKQILDTYYPSGTASQPPAPLAPAISKGKTPGGTQADQPENPFLVPAEPAPQTKETSVEPANPFNIGSGPEQSAPQQSDGDQVDETALRYYADQRELERVGAEIRRLKTLYPDWSPPSDLFAPRSNVSEQPVWDLYADGKYAEARGKIEELKRSDANYRPSSALVAKLAEAEARLAIRTMSDRGDWSGTIEAARAMPDLLVCSEMDSLWRLGEAFARTENFASAFDLYTYILTKCPNQAERRATIEKAAGVLPQKGLDALLALGETLPGGERELEGLEFTKLRTLLAKETSEPTAGRSPIDAEELQRFETFAKTDPNNGDASLLGWYFYGRGDYENASRWFEIASTAADDDKAIEGYLLSLRNQDELETAEAIAHRYRERSPNFSKIYVELVADRINGLEEDETLSDKDLDAFTSVVEDSKSALGAQTLGWYLLDQEETEEAGEWFEKSVAWEPNEEGVVGLAVVASREKDNKALVSVKEEYGERYAALGEFEEYRPVVRQPVVRAPSSQKARSTQASTAKKSRSKPRRSGGGAADRLMKEANRQFDAGNYQGALNALNQREAKSGKTYGAEILRGWANLKMNRWNEAEKVFRTQDRKRSTKDTRFGIGAVQNSKYNMWPETRNKCTSRPC